MATYRIGVIETSPINGVTVGGLHFPRFTERVSGLGATTRRDKIDGSIVEIDDERIKRIKAECEFKLIRINRNKKGEVRRAQVHDKRTRRYREVEGDVPVSEVIYIERLEENPHQSATRTPLAGAPKKQEKTARRRSA